MYKISGGAHLRHSDGDPAVIGFLVKRVFGTKHERDIKKLVPIVEQINEI